METSQLTERPLTAGDTFGDHCLRTYGWMLAGRALEDKLRSLYRAGKIVGGVYLGRGQEAFSTALGANLDRKKDDVFGPLIRDCSGRLAFGEPMVDVLRTYLGSATGPMRGRDGNIHRGRPRDGLPAMISHLGSLVPVVNGMLMARRMKGQTDFVGAATIGDGGTSTGAFHEAVNQAAVEKLPLVIAVANNQFAYSTVNDRQFACENLVDRAIGYGIRGHSVDGTSLTACQSVFEEAVDRARRGEGPQLVEGHLLRLSGHGEHDDASYVPDELKHAEVGRDCLEVGRQEILKEGWADEATLDAWLTEIQREIDEVLGIVSREAKPDGSRENWYALSSKHLCEGIPGA